jgi:hypothetical protein
MHTTCTSYNLKRRIYVYDKINTDFKTSNYKMLVGMVIDDTVLY